jgi:hypothetical protein
VLLALFKAEVNLNQAAGGEPTAHEQHGDEKIIAHQTGPLAPGEESKRGQIAQIQFSLTPLNFNAAFYPFQSSKESLQKSVGLPNGTYCSSAKGRTRRLQSPGWRYCDVFRVR